MEKVFPDEFWGWGSYGGGGIQFETPRASGKLKVSINACHGFIYRHTAR